MSEIETAIGPLRVELAHGQRHLHLAVVETADGPMFPANAVVPVGGLPPQWGEQLARGISVRARRQAARELAPDLADDLLAYVATLGDEVCGIFASADPDDREYARASTIKALEYCLTLDDAYQAARNFERDTMFGTADVRLVDLMRGPDVLDRAARVAADPQTVLMVVREMERECLAKSQLVRRSADAYREQRRAPTPS